MFVRLKKGVNCATIYTIVSYTIYIMCAKSKKEIGIKFNQAITLIYYRNKDGLYCKNRVDWINVFLSKGLILGALPESLESCHHFTGAKVQKCFHAAMPNVVKYC